MNIDSIQVVSYQKDGSIIVYDIDEKNTHIGNKHDPLTTIAVKTKTFKVEG